jgi:hypothetical protein
LPVNESRVFTVFANVEITSEGLLARTRGVKMEAKASSVTTRGKILVRDIGRWREKKEVAATSVKWVSQSQWQIKAH